MSKKEKMEAAKDRRGDKDEGQNKQLGCKECNLPGGKHATNCSWHIANLI